MLLLLVLLLGLRLTRRTLLLRRSRLPTRRLALSAFTRSIYLRRVSAWRSLGSLWLSVAAALAASTSPPSAAPFLGVARLQRSLRAVLLRRGLSWALLFATGLSRSLTVALDRFGVARELPGEDALDQLVALFLLRIEAAIRAATPAFRVGVLAGGAGQAFRQRHPGRHCTHDRPLRAFPGGDRR
jgi:hypothetical protein